MASVLEIKQRLVDKEAVLNELIEKAEKLANKVEAKEKAIDALDWATQIGRLDLLTVVLTVLTVVVGFAGVVSYINIKSTAIEEARKEAKTAAKDEIKEKLDSSVAKYLDENPNVWSAVLRDNPGLISSALEGPLGTGLAKLNPALANQIANNISEEMEVTNGDNSETN